jgi:small-conductance mechanosensitive channel
MKTLQVALCAPYDPSTAYKLTTPQRLRPAQCLQVTLMACLYLLHATAVLASTDSKSFSESAHDSSTSSEFVAVDNAGVPVEIDGRPILSIYAQVGSFTAEERAHAIQQRILALTGNRNIGVEAIHAEDRGAWTEIVAGSARIMGITEMDARAAERPRAELAAEYTEVLRQVVRQYREEHTWRRSSWAALYALLATAGTAGLLFGLFVFRRRAGSRVKGWLARRQNQASTGPLASRLTRYLEPPFTIIFRTLFWILVLGLVQTYVAVVLRFFPSTKYTSYRLTNWLFSELAAFGKTCIGYVPNLLLIALICLLTSYLIKLNRYIFEEIRSERLTIQGFYPDWAEPTAKLVRFLILAAAAIVVFPYLPGSESPAFKGISVFLGVLLSLGSTSAVAHGVAGTILTYMRAFQIGDFVRIGSEVGEVVEKTLLVTRICTQKNEVVTIPNGTVLGGVVVNYSAEARHNGVIFHTTVTIGYSVPWRQVHDLLISAAVGTADVLEEPAPFVIQTALNDFYVAYELNAYTVKPNNMQYIYSALHQNIQDRFNEAGVEINSPHYASLRDGNRTTIPNSYLPGSYKSPVFEVQQVNGSAVEEAEVKDL